MTATEDVVLGSIAITKHTDQPAIPEQDAPAPETESPTEEEASLIANAESLDALLTVKRNFSAYLLPEEDKDPKVRAIAWQSLIWAIWGKDSENGGRKVIKAAPVQLRELYEQIFH